MVDDEHAMKSRSGIAGSEGEATLRMSAEEALLKALARVITSAGSEMSAGVILFTTSAAV